MIQQSENTDRITEQFTERFSESSRQVKVAKKLQKCRKTCEIVRLRSDYI